MYSKGEVIDLTNDKDDKDEDLVKAIALSLQDAQVKLRFQLGTVRS